MPGGNASRVRKQGALRHFVVVAGLPLLLALDFAYVTESPNAPRLRINFPFRWFCFSLRT